MEIAIPILPTRHGNGNIARRLGNGGTYSDPTYEAWKLFKLKGNAASITEFRSYLRGMETSPSLLLEGLYLHIPILPTRHGNFYLLDNFFI